MRNTCKVLVTGGSGFLGYHLILRLLALGIHVRSIDYKESPIKDKGLEFIQGDFTNTQVLQNAMEGCRIIFHLAYTSIPETSNQDPVSDIQSNLTGSISLLDLAVKNQIKKVIFISSGGTVYGTPERLPVDESHPTHPICAYGITKLAVEKYLFLYQTLYGLRTVSLRLSNLYGERQQMDTGQGAVTTFCHKALNNETIEIWGDGSVIRDYVYVKDVVDAMIKTMTVEYTGKPINIGCGHGISLNSLIAEIERMSQRTVDVVYKEKRLFDVPQIYLDISRAKTVLNWEPKTSLARGISNTLTWLHKDFPTFVVGRNLSADLSNQPMASATLGIRTRSINC